MTYFNTTQETNPQLALFTDKAKCQDEIILSLFQKHGRLSPSRCWVLVQQISPSPLTSIRRGISNLTREGKLIKTSEKAVGIYKRPELVWELKK